MKFLVTIRFLGMFFSLLLLSQHNFVFAHQECNATQLKTIRSAIGLEALTDLNLDKLRHVLQEIDLRPLELTMNQNEWEALKDFVMGSEFGCVGCRNLGTLIAPLPQILCPIKGTLPPNLLATCSTVLATSSWQIVLQFSSEAMCNAYAKSVQVASTYSTTMEGYEKCGSSTYCYDGANGIWQINQIGNFSTSAVLWQNIQNASSPNFGFTFGNNNPTQFGSGCVCHHDACTLVTGNCGAITATDGKSFQLNSMTNNW